MSSFKIIEVYTKGCLACDYAYRLMKKIGIYDNIQHIENINVNNEELKTNKFPTFFIFYNNKMIKKITDIDRTKIEDLRRYI